MGIPLCILMLSMFFLPITNNQGTTSSHGCSHSFGLYISSLKTSKWPTCPATNLSKTGREPPQEDKSAPGFSIPKIESIPVMTEEKGAQKAIESFDEWTKKRRDAVATAAAGNIAIAVANGGVVSNVKVSTNGDGDLPGTVPIDVVNTIVTTPRRNFASLECGAKIIATNSEAQNAKAVLNDKDLDDYMRNPCEEAKEKFIVIELCEAIQVKAISIGNFELFASRPRQISVFASERYPPVGQWVPLGSYTLQDHHKKLQSFDVLESHGYAKFVRINLDDHYGKEHFCIVSVVNVIGSTLSDEYEKEEAAVRLLNTPADVLNSAVVIPSATSSDPIEPMTTPPPSEQSMQTQLPIPPRSTEKKKVDGNVSRSISEVRRSCWQCPSSSKSETSSQWATCLLMGIDVSSDSEASGSKNGTMSRPKSWRTVGDMNSASKMRRRRRNVATIQRWDRIMSQRDTKAEATSSKTIRELGNVVDTVKKPKKEASEVKGEECANNNGTNKTVPSTINEPRVSGKEKKLKLNPESTEHQQLTTSSTNGDSGIPVTTTPRPASSTSDENRVLPTPPSPTPQPHVSAKNEKIMPATVGGSTNQRELVLMKLSKRIAAVEMNLTESTEYLNVLSKQYVSQMSGYQEELREVKKGSKEATRSVDLWMRSSMNKLRREMRDIRRQLHKLERYADGAWPRSLFQKSGALEGGLDVPTCHVRATVTQPPARAQLPLIPPSDEKTKRKQNGHFEDVGDFFANARSVFFANYSWNTDHLIVTLIVSNGIAFSLLFAIVAIFWRRNNAKIETAQFEMRQEMRKRMANMAAGNRRMIARGLRRSELAVTAAVTSSIRVEKMTNYKKTKAELESSLSAQLTAQQIRMDELEATIELMKRALILSERSGNNEMGMLKNRRESTAEDSESLSETDQKDDASISDDV